MQIDATMQISAENAAALQAFDGDNDLTLTEGEWQGNPTYTTAERPRNARRRYYRLLDRITGEPGRYGGHFVCHNPLYSPSAYAVHFEYR